MTGFTEKSCCSFGCCITPWSWNFINGILEIRKWCYEGGRNIKYWTPFIAVDAGDNDHGNPAGGWENSREMVVADWLVPEGLEGTPEPASLPLFQFQSWHDLHQQNQPTVHHFVSSRIIVPHCASSATSSYCASSHAKAWGKMGEDDYHPVMILPSSSYPYHMIFVKKFTQTEFLAKNFTP